MEKAESSRTDEETEKRQKNTEKISRPLAVMYRHPWKNASRKQITKSFGGGASECFLQ